MRTLHIYTLHVFVGYILEVIHVFLMYAQRFLSVSVLMRSSDSLSIGVMCSEGRNGSANNLRMNFMVTSSLMVAACNPNSCTLCHTAWVQWKTHHLRFTSGSTSRSAFHVACSKSSTTFLICMSSGKLLSTARITFL